MSYPWNTETDPYNNTRTGYLGKHREEMLTNEILQKARVGIAKRRGRILPSKTFTYGESYRSPWTAAHALRNWEGTFPSAKEIKQKQMAKYPTDFLQLNRGALSAGMVTSREFHLFRKVKRPLKLKPAADDPTHPGKALERPLPKSFTYDQMFGHVPKQDPPLVDILSHEFQKQFIRESKREKLEIKAHKPNFKIVKSNRASLLRPAKEQSGVEEQPWRNPRFLRKAKPHLSTFRSESAKAAAHLAHQFEAQGRYGETGQGIERLYYHAHPLPPIKGPEKCPPGVGAKAWSFCD